MGRPPPAIIMSAHVNDKLTLQIIEADYVYTVLYKGNVVNVRTCQTYANYPGPKYKRISFANPAHAFNLMERLNKLFKTKDFTVCQISPMGQGRAVSEDGLQHRG